MYMCTVSLLHPLCHTTVTLRDKDGCTPLALAQAHSHEQCIALLQGRPVSVSEEVSSLICLFLLLSSLLFNSANRLGLPALSFSLSLFFSLR